MIENRRLCLFGSRLFPTPSISPLNFIISFLLIALWYSMCTNTTFCFAVHQLLGILAISVSWLLWIEKHQAWMSTYLYSKKWSVLAIYPRMVQLHLVVDLFPTFQRTSALISLVVSPVCTLSKSEYVFSFFHILAIIHCRFFFLNQSHFDWH